jgi:hypothetical protein
MVSSMRHLRRVKYLSLVSMLGTDSLQSYVSPICNYQTDNGDETATGFTKFLSCKVGIA